MRPLGNKILLEIVEEKMGAIQTDTIQEHGIIVDVADGLCMANDGSYCGFDWGEQLGKTLYFKAWAVDIITDGDKKYYFISADSDAICGIKEN
jgi:co-chaperonin GroES (HSP10)